MASIERASQRVGWYYGWNIVVVCVLSQIAVNGLPASSFSLFLHDWSEEFHTPISTLQLGMAAYVFLLSCLGPFAGTMADKYPARLMFGAGLLCLAAFCVSISLVTEAWQILALYCVFMPFAAAFAALVTANAVVSRWFVRRLGLALALTAFGVAIPGILLPPIVASFLPSVGWRMIWRVVGIIIALIITPFVFFVLRDRPTERDGLDYVTGASAGQAGRSKPQPPADMSWQGVFSRPNFWLILLPELALVGSYGGALQNLAPIITSHGFSPQLAGSLIGVFSFAQLASTFVMGLLSDRYGNRLPIVGLTVATALGCLLLIWASSLPALFLSIVLIGLAGGIYPLVGAALMLEFGSALGRAYGVLGMFKPVIMFAPFMVAKLQEATGSYSSSLIVYAATCLLSGIACLWLRERRGTSLTSTAAEVATASA